MNAEFIISTKSEKWERKHVHHSGSALSMTYIISSVKAKTFFKDLLTLLQNRKKKKTTGNSISWKIGQGSIRHGVNKVCIFFQNDNFPSFLQRAKNNML